jgi:Met-zincin/Domain of unknown function (DUF5117)
MKKHRVTALIIILTLAAPAAAQKQLGNDMPTIAEKTAGMQKLEGFFNLYWEEKAEKIWLEIGKTGQEFLYVSDLVSSVRGWSRGSWSGGQVMRFDRFGSKIFLIQVNFQNRAISDAAAERRAVAEAYTDPAIFGFRIAAEEGGRVLVDATDFFMRDAMNLGGGGIDRNRSAFCRPNTKNFPKNTEVELLLTYNSAPSLPAWGRAAGAPPAAAAGRDGGGSADTTIRLRHSLVELPDNQYRPRRYDPRSGVFGIDFRDYASPFNEPVRKEWSSRFRLVKQDPNAPVSDPVKPLVFYVDPGVPEPIRSALVEGASWWNEAFEAAGFRNAFQAKVLPADADPMDLRYNMILWIHSPGRSWSSGASLRDPRTGEIIAGRVYLGSDRIRQDFLIGSGLKALYTGKDPDTREIEEMALARIRQLSAHEVGHTLGFAHNYVSSIANRASVMDYPHPYIKIRDNGTLDFSEAYTTGIGEWDKVFVAYAYSHFPDGTDEDEALDKILNDAQARGLYCLGEAGADSAHPFSNDWDNGPDPLAELERVMRIRQIALQNFSEGNIPRRTPMARLEEVLVPVYLFHRYQTEAVSHSLGGVDYRPAVRGDGQKILEVVPPEIQRRALRLLLTTITPEALALPRGILKLIPPRAGVNGGEVFPRYTSDTFDPLATAQTAAHLTVSLILNPARAARLLSNRALDSNAPTLGEVIDTLLATTWKPDASADPYLAEIQRVADDTVLHDLMGLAASGSPEVRAVASLKIFQLKSRLSSGAGMLKDDRQQAHFRFGASEIDRFQADPAKFALPEPATAPPGAPIGLGELPGPWVYWDR